MRIQHNILAMNAYRNYNTNTSALAKNLEKLSSGYKINRAGDDAAGLAISEKMRAQITGLNAAQKNVKDGVSLVKTAEGAMQEIQDMLNRMDYLATQSANGTYDDPVDRLNLQKEVEQLKSEINRIADSANFNGIKLLDGSLDASKLAQDAVTETVTVDPTKENALTFASGKLAEVGQVLGTNTVLHNEANGSNGTSFSIDFHNFKFNAAKNNTMTIKMGDSEITLKATEDHGKVEGADLVNAFLGGGGYEITVDGKTVDTLDGMKINGQTMKVDVATDPTKDYRLTFTQESAPASEAEEINGSMEVNISGKVEPKKAQFTFKASDLGTSTIGGVVTINGQSYTIKDTDPTGTPTAQTWSQVFADMEKEGILEGYKIKEESGTVTLTAKEAGKMTTPTVSYKPTKAGTATAGATTTGAAATAAKYTTDDQTALTADGDLTIGGYTVSIDVATQDDLEKQLTEFARVYNADAKNTEWTAAVSTDKKKIEFTAKTAGAIGGEGPKTAPTGTTAVTGSEGADAVKESAKFTVTGWNNSNLGSLTVSVNGTDYELDYDKLSAAGEKGLEMTDDSGNSSGYIVTMDGDELTFTAKVGGDADGTNGTPAATISDTDLAFSVYDDANAKKLSEADRTIEVVEQGAEGGEMQGITEGAHGDFNVSTTNIQNVSAGGAERLASTYFDLTEDMVADGATIKIGESEFTFTTDEKKVGTSAGNVTFVDARGDLVSTAKNLTEAARGNAIWTVGHDGSRITLTETVEHGQLDTNETMEDYRKNATFDLSTQAGIEQSLGFTGAGSYTKEEVVSEATEGGKALTLQIGDTSDSFNQLKVSVGDMHTSAMGTGKTTLDGKEIEVTKTIADIDIGTLEGAQEAIAVVKNAINYVSGVRGDLGATQNRLEHTANNLSVMAENIQDAESTIRDTDIAEEMMAYTKNNILIQSAQAMLAQANAVPQGVLQLLG